MAKDKPSHNFPSHNRFTSVFHQKSILFLLACLILALNLAGCVTLNDPEASQEFNADTIGVLTPQTSLGQTFVSRRPRLNGITLWLSPTSNQQEANTQDAYIQISAEIFHSPSDSVPIFESTFHVPSQGSISPVTITLPNIKNQAEANFYLRLSTISGSVDVKGRSENSYPGGEAYMDELPIDADMAFRLSYEYDQNAFLNDLEKIVSNMWLIFPLLVILILPGWMLLDVSGILRRFDFGERVAISIGISLALTPLIMLWTSVLKIEWTRSGLLFVTGFLTALLLIRIIYQSFRRNNQHNPSVSAELDQTERNSTTSNHYWQPFLALTLIFIFTLVIRLITIRDLATPAWVDSVHHALITRQILSDGSYPSTYQPFLDIQPTDYHPGFHSLAAGFTWLSELPLEQSLLIFGQVLNAVSVLSVYLFTRSLTRNTSAALIAAVITGCLTPMPAYYTSWGRYTELTGLIILPAAFVLIILNFRSGKSGQSSWVILFSAIAAAGLFMVHYRVALFLVILILSFVLINIPRYLNASRDDRLRILRNSLFFIIASSTLIIPWLWQSLRDTIIPAFTPQSLSTVPLFHDFSWAYLTTAYGKQTLALAGLGLIWGLIIQKRFSLLLCLWIILLLLVANFGALNLYGSGIITPSSVEIMLFMPISVLGGFFLSQIISSLKELIPHRLHLPINILVTICIGVVAYLGAHQLISILNPVTILSRNGDLPAIEWLSANIPQDETIVVNPFNWGYGIYAGADGGYWISPLSGIETLPPPVLYGLGDQVSEINQQVEQVIALSPTPKAFAEFLKNKNLQYIFIGSKGGMISPKILNSSGLFDLLYHNEGVWIFHLKP